MAQLAFNACNAVLAEARRFVKKYEHLPKERMFTFCWQSTSRVDVRYLAYRWFQFAVHLTIATMSLCEIGRTMHSDYFAAVHAERSMKYYMKWLLYLTHWGLLLNVAQSYLGAWMTQKTFFKQQSTGNPNAQADLSKSLIGLYHRLFAVSLNLSAYISIGFWLMVFDPTDSVIDPVTVSEHGLGCVLLFIDLIVSNVPYQLVAGVHAVILSTFYLFVTYVHHLTQGLDRYQDKHYLYEKCDWTHTLTVLGYYVVSMMTLSSFHCLLWSIFLLRRHISMNSGGTNRGETPTSSAPASESSTSDLKEEQPPTTKTAIQR